MTSLTSFIQFYPNSLIEVFWCFPKMWKETFTTKRSILDVAAALDPPTAFLVPKSQKPFKLTF